MAKNDLFEKINETSPNFTKVENKIAKFVIDNPTKALYMSITDLANACCVGDTSVFRLCKSLKLKGYQEFRMLLAQSIELEDENEIDSNSSSQSCSSIPEKVMNSYINALNQTNNMVESDMIDDCVKKLETAKRICFFGVGSSLLTAMDAKNKFMRIMPNVECIFDSHFQTMQASLLTESDVAMIYSVSGSTKDIIEIAKTCKANGVQTICIVCSKKSPLSEYADIEMVCGAKEGPLEGGSYSAKITQLYATDLIYNQYRIKNLENSTKNREITSNSIISKMY